MLEQRDYNAEFEVWFQKLLLYMEQRSEVPFEKETYDTVGYRYGMRDYFINFYTPEEAWSEEQTYNLDGQ